MSDHRRYGLQQRKQISSKARTRAHQDILNFIHQQNLLQPGATIGCYLSLPTEVDTQILIQTAWQQQCNVVVPVINNELLQFQPLRPDQALVSTPLGFQQPDYSGQTVALNEIDILFMPLTCVDQQGHRVGMGKGYYDKTLAPVRHQYTPYRIGLAYQQQVVDSLLPQPWDVALHALITQEHYTVF